MTVGELRKSMRYLSDDCELDFMIDCDQSGYRVIAFTVVKQTDVFEIEINPDNNE